MMNRVLPPECYVYGTGTFAAKMAHELAGSGSEVLGFIDRTGRADVSSRRPSDASLRRDVPILLGVCNPQVDVLALSGELQRGGFDDIWTPVEVAIGVGAAGGHLDCYWLTSDVAVYEHAGQSIDAARSLFSDETSLRIFDDALAYRRTGQIRPFVVESLAEQYLGRPFDYPTGPIRLLDGGAYDGDTIRGFTDAGVQLQAVIACEPDPGNFRRLNDYLDGRPEIDSLPLPVALSDETRLVRFDATSTAAARVSPGGGRPVLAIRADDVLQGWRPTHIKMDIEGAELDALVGMQLTLKADRPHLAVSAYHLPDHLWRIPLWLAEADLGYQMYLRCYGHQTFDIVLYAVPPQGQPR